MRELIMNKSTKPVRLDVWGDGMVNQLKSIARKRRKREASKKRRKLLDDIQHY